MREKNIETALVRAVRKHGGLALKFVSPGMAGVPDRILLFPGGRVAFAELKAPGKKPRPLQIHRHDQLRALGFQVYVVDSMEKLNQLIPKINPTWNEGEGNGGTRPFCYTNVEHKRTVPAVTPAG